MKYLINFIYLFLSFGLVAQVDDTIEFKDEADHHLQRYFQSTKHDNGIIIAGKMSNANSEIPILFKLNSDGEVVWSTSTCLEKERHYLRHASFMVADDGFIYATANFSLKRVSSINNLHTSRFYKIDAATGDVKWTSVDIEHIRSNLGLSGYDNHFMELGSSKMAFGLAYLDYEGFIVDKITGAVLDTFEKRFTKRGSTTIIADQSDNFIYSNEKSLYKLNQQNFDDIIWQTDFSDIRRIQKVYEDKFGDLFVFTSGGGAKKIDPVLGTEVWSKQVTYYADFLADETLVALVETNEFFYLSFNYRGNSHYAISKVNKSTGEVVWQSFETIDAINAEYPNAAGHSAALSMDIDCNGDLILAGRYADSSKTQMGLMKLDGANGNKLNEAVVELNQDDNPDVGLFAGVFEDKIVFLGSEIIWVAYEHPLSKTKIIQTDSELNIISQKDVISGIKFGSEVVQMVPNGNSTYVMQQKGAEIELIKRNNDGTVGWTSTFGNEEYTQADYLAIGDTYAYVSSRGVAGDDGNLLLYQIAIANGTVTKSVIVNSTENDFPHQTYELEVVNDVAYVYYSPFPTNKNSSLTINKWAGGVISNPNGHNASELFLDKKEENLIVPFGQYLFYADNSYMHSIDRITLELDLDPNPGTLNFYETRNTIQNDSIIFAFGNSVFSDSQYVRKYDMFRKRLIWGKNLASAGSLKAMTRGEGGYLYAMGKTDGLSNLIKISEETGEQVWNKDFVWASDVVNEKELYLNYDSAKNQIIRYFASEKNTTSQILKVEIYDTLGNLLIQKSDETILNEIEDYVFSVNTDGSILIGGTSEESCVSGSTGKLIPMESLYISTPIETTAQIQNISCAGSIDGSILVEVTGGTTPYSYELLDSTGAIIIVPSQSNNIFENLGTGNYMIRVQDAGGQVVIESLLITETPPLNAEVIVTNSSCMGVSNGTIHVNATGGSGEYLYALDSNPANFRLENTFDNLAAGFYSVYVSDSNGCMSILTVLITEPSDNDLNNDGIGDSCQDDLDGDGVINSLDECPNSPIGTIVNAVGCEKFSLPNDNFILQITDESCASSNNGTILLTAVEDLNYTATISSEGNSFSSKKFRTFTSFQALEARTYGICITITEYPEYEKCFSVQISEPEALSVDSKVDTSGKSLSLSLKGGVNYIINLNGSVYDTSESQITLPLEDIENELSIRTDKDCQGSYDEIILMSPGLSIYPNPVFNDDVTILLDDHSIQEIELLLYSDSGRRVMQKIIEMSNGKAKMNMSTLPSGIYSLKINTENQTYNRRIIKK